MKLLIFQRDWADEFLAEEMAVLTNSEWASFKHWLLHEADLIGEDDDYWPGLYFGANEGWEDEDPSEMYESIQVRDISELEGVFLREHILGSKYRAFGVGVLDLLLYEWDQRSA